MLERIILHCIVGEILRWHIVCFAYKNTVCPITLCNGYFKPFSLPLSSQGHTSSLLSEQFWDGILCRNFAYKKGYFKPFSLPLSSQGHVSGKKNPHYWTLHTETLHVLYQAMVILNPFPFPYPHKGMRQEEESLIIIVTAILRCRGQLNAGDVVVAYEITACHVSDGDDGAVDEWRNCGIAAGGVLRGIMCGVS